MHQNYPLYYLIGVDSKETPGQVLAWRKEILAYWWKRHKKEMQMVKLRLYRIY